METFVLSKRVNFFPIPQTNEFVAFHSLFGNAIKIDNETRESLLNINSGSSRKKISRRFSISKEVLGHLITIGFLESSEENIDQIMKQRLNERLEKARNGKLIRSLRFFSSGCNIQCDYCSIKKLGWKEKRRRFTGSLVTKISEEFINLVKGSEYKTAYVRFFGGEPLLDWDVFQQAVLFIEEIKQDVNVKYHLNTNGMLISDNIARFIKEHSITTIISLDGTEFQHNEFRKFKNGSGTYSQVENGIKTLKRNEVPFKLNAVLHEENFQHVEDVVSIAKTLGAYELGLDDLCFLENGSRCTAMDISTRIKSLIKAFEFGKTIGMNVSGAWAGFRSFTKEKNPIPYCFGNGEELCINSKGEIFSCYGFSEPIGTILSLRDCFSNPLYLKLAGRIPGNIQLCRDCEFQGPCAGECSADMKSLNGLEFMNEKCKLRKELFRHILISTAQQT